MTELNKEIWEEVSKYKTNYDVKNFSLDVMSDAISTYLENSNIQKYVQKTVPYHIELQQKLNKVRSQIEYNNTWYTPTFEELKEGDEVEIMSSYGWIKGTFPDILKQETHVNMAAYRANDDSNEFRFKNVTIRKKL